jgi:hypothetical protein
MSEIRGQCCQRRGKHSEEEKELYSRCTEAESRPRKQEQELGLDWQEVPEELSLLVGVWKAECF